MRKQVYAVALFAVFVVVLAGCRTDTGKTRPLEMTDSDLALAWAITIFQEGPCGGPDIAGGELAGSVTYEDVGQFTITMSSAWDIGDLLDDADKQFEPVSLNAAGPAAPVLGVSAYPHEFVFNPFTGACLEPSEEPVTATGQVLFVETDGAELYGRVVGGETYRLDFVVEGDGIETFNIVEFVGGTGRFSGATGSFVAHSVLRFDHDEQEFVMDLAEVLPGGTITF